MSSICRPDARPCASENGSGRCTVSPTVPNAYELLSTEAFSARVSDCRPLDYGECALFRKLNLFMHCLPSLLYAFLCSVTLARGRVCVYILCLFSDIYVRRPKAAGVLSGSFMRLSRAACAKCSGVNILLRGIWRLGRRAAFVRRNIPCVNLNLRHMHAQNI